MTSYTYQEAGIRSDGGEYCSCCRFSKGIDLPSPRELSLKEIKLEAERYSARILKDWTALSGYVKRFETIIQRRWLRKTNKQRQEILLKAWPGMSRHHRPDFIGSRTKRFRKLPQSVTATNRSHAFLWPYINLEDLQQGHLMPLFLNSRARDFPVAFTALDLQNAHRGHGWPAYVEDGEAGIAFAKGWTPRTYGRLIVQKGTTSQRVIRPVYPPIVGLLILEIQDGIYNFLLSFAQAVMHDIGPHAWYIAPSTPEPEAPSKNPKSDGCQWRSLPAYALEAPYRRPQQLDINRLQTLVTARCAAAEDHIWLLREDPGYFIETLKDTMEHGIEQYVKSRDAEHAWAHAAGRLLADAFCSFLLWDELDSKLSLLPSVEEQLKCANPKTGRLCVYDEGLWAYMDAIIDKLMSIPMSMLDRGVPMSPRIRAISDIQLKPDGTHSWQLKSNRTEAERRIYVLFWDLFDPEQTELHGLCNLIQEIQHAIDAEPEIADLLDPWVIDKFSDVALIAEFQRTIDTFQPWARGWRMNKVAEKGTLSHLVEVSLSRDGAHLEVLTEAPHATSKILGIPTDGRFVYPVDKKQTKETVGQMRNAEQQLSDFWSAIGKFFHESTGRDLMDEFHLRAQQTRKIHKTPKWVEPMPGEREDGGVALPMTPVTPASKILQDVDVNACRGKESENKRREILDSAKASKIKTRKAELPIQDTPPRPAPRVEDVPQEADTKHEAIKLPKRVYKVFAAMLPRQDAQGHVGKEVAWDELLYAFSNIGFQPEKLYGSVWVFRPLSDGSCKVADVTRSISFHEPKEVRKGHKMPPNMVRTFGRRLKHAYGWENGMFECE